MWREIFDVGAYTAVVFAVAVDGAWISNYSPSFWLVAAGAYNTLILSPLALPPIADSWATKSGRIDLIYAPKAFASDIAELHQWRVATAARLG